MPSHWRLKLMMTASAPEHFDAIAGNYAASEVHSNSPTIRRLHELLAAKRLESVCELGCGPGHLALSFAGKASRVVGVDAAPNMLRQFERLAKERKVKVEAIRACADSVPLPSDTFDAVVSRLAPHHFPDVAKAVLEMARLTKPGGCVAVIDLESNENSELDDLNHTIEVLHDPSHVRSYTAARWREFFKSNMLFVETLESKQTELPGGLTVRRWCEIGNTPPESESKIRALLAAASKGHLAGLGIRDDGGEFRIPVRTLIIIGCKAR